MLVVVMGGVQKQESKIIINKVENSGWFYPTLTIGEKGRKLQRNWILGLRF